MSTMVEQRPRVERSTPGALPHGRSTEPRSTVDVAVALDDELTGGRVAVDELGQQRDPHRDRDADGKLLPRRQSRFVAANPGVAGSTGTDEGQPHVGRVDVLV